MDYQKRQRIYKTIMLIVLVALLTFILTTIFMYQYLGGETKYIYVSGNDGGISNKLSSFRKLIDQKYLGEVDEKSLEEGAIKGYISGLKDPYTEYITKDEMEEYTESIMGNFVGIGVYLMNDTQTNTIIVLSPIKNAPAQEAGILPGDRIIKVDDITYTGEQLTEATNKIKGEEGTAVKIEVLRDGETKVFEIIRKTVKVNYVEAKVLENNIGYIAFNSFDEECSQEFKQKYDELKNKGIKKLIIDIRNNGGGLVEEAINISDYIVEKDKTLLITLDKNGNEKITKSENDPVINMPIVIITNENTASASEILAGALKDNNKATIVGTKTYGKGVIQELLTLQDGSGLKITTNEYYTPNRNKINNIGIEPDVKVELSEEQKNKVELDEKNDTQLQKAIETIKSK